MPYKTGGGGKPELYDPENGQYTDEEKNALFEQELGNIVLRNLFHDKENTYEPRYPIDGFHTKIYCLFYVRETVAGSEIYVDDAKVRDYLVVLHEQNDKSKFFKKMGYTKDNWQELHKEIYAGSDSKKVKFNKLNKHGLRVEIETEIPILNEKPLYMRFKTIWLYDEKTKKLKFITAIPKDAERTFKYEKH